LPQKVIRATEKEKQDQITVVENLNKGNALTVEEHIAMLKQKALNH